MASKLNKSIKVTDKVWEELMILKVKLRADDIDSVIRLLLEEYRKKGVAKG